MRQVKQPNVVMPQKLIDSLREIAKETHKTYSDVTREALWQYADNFKVKQQLNTTKTGETQ